ncbi:MAG: TolB family protein [Pyrinomonadaceae bacterium]
MRFIVLLVFILAISISNVSACGSMETELALFEYQPNFSFLQTDNLAVPGEKHLKNIKQLTFGGENAEAYFSFDGKQLIFQSKRDERACDQIYQMNIDGSNVRMVSNGEGRTTCSYFFKNGKRVLYASTFGGGKDCPPPANMSKGYVWAIYPDYEIYTSTPDGKDIKKLTDSKGYDAEATISPDGKKSFSHRSATAIWNCIRWTPTAKISNV